MSNSNEPNFGMVGGDKASFERWALDKIDLKSFDLINFIGADDEPTDNVEYGSTEQERKETVYTTQQYNQLMFQNDFQNDMHNNFENQYPGVQNYIGAQGNNRPVLSGNVGYGNNMDSSMIPTTSKSSMPMPIKIEPDYEQVENSVGRLHFDDSGTYSDDVDSYAHSLGSVGAYDHDGVFHPRTKPRKYRIKPVEEKQNPFYKIKREKNNDAVRRSRDKAKRIQLEKDERLALLEAERSRTERTIQQQRLTIEKLQQQLNTFARQCNCGAARM